MHLILFACSFWLLILSQLQAVETLQKEDMNLKTVKVGGVQLVKLDNGYQVWTKRVGKGPIKILLLHGGPGYTHECLECFEDFFPSEQFQLIYYDQLGSYYSDQPKDPSLWKIERFCQEIEQVRQALELENFYLYGYSWGSMLAIEYALKYQNYLKGLILSNMTASVASYETYLNELKGQLPQIILDQLESYEKSGNITDPEYEKLMFEQIYSRYICRIDPWPEPLLRTARHFNKEVHDTVFGPNEFVITGTCKQWNRSIELKMEWKLEDPHNSLPNTAA